MMYNIIEVGGRKKVEGGVRVSVPEKSKVD